MAPKARAPRSRAAAKGHPGRSAAVSNLPPRRSEADVLVLLPPELRDVPLCAREAPWIPLELAPRLDANANRRLRSRLPYGVQPAPRALERTVWAAICRRVVVEANNLRALGMEQKVAFWEERLVLMSRERDGVLRRRRDAYFLELAHREQAAIRRWNEAMRREDEELRRRAEGERLMQLLNVTRWRDRAEGCVILD